LHYKTGDKQKAVEVQTKAYELSGNNPDYKKTLDKMKGGN
jgi:hypothetical protein